MCLSRITLTTFQAVRLKAQSVWSHPTVSKCQGVAYYQDLKKLSVLRQEASEWFPDYTVLKEYIFFRKHSYTSCEGLHCAPPTLKFTC